MNSDATATTEYGEWSGTVDGTTLNAQHQAVELLAGHASDYDAEALGKAYADAINAALPPAVTLAGEQFYGPYRPPADAWDGYPTRDGQLDIRAIVEGVYFWRLARAHEYGATVYVTIEAGSEDSPGRFIWQLLTDVERMDQEDDLGLTAHDLAKTIADTQEVADGDLWRVQVWAGPDERGTPNLAPLAEYLHDTRNND